ncbi:F0F1 ATP synthase subunit delta [Helicobacter cappadocius]|uniref:ATP synthase subunit delta n=1 Tax=Helicobacter cappadocius TaxID=3063998 RepID=A0AA90PR53_9HELI|nr:MULTISPECIES: F0F1 ATP synthase subunit delta [unclassified Helicobacter]MDO7252749.1 F0F1 ATP synthase subunit delta [Helicobacter sp. faydin-H75]MDP2538617.1 F0F1 ATP synthase subunit delta [Helicobacter sp. faydin-H76]
MVEIIAKKYAKAVVQSIGFADLDSFLQNLKTITQAFASDKFVDIIDSPHISKTKKQDFLLDFIDKKYSKFNEMKNFIKILVQSNRIDLIPYICDMLKTYLDEQNNFYTGILYTDKQIKPEDIEHIRKNLSKRLDIDFNIEQVVTSIEGIKLVIEDLDIEISFSKEYFLRELRSYILKAI